jgi:hypothetical protein
MATWGSSNLGNHDGWAGSQPVVHALRRAGISLIVMIVCACLRGGELSRVGSMI